MALFREMLKINNYRGLFSGIGSGDHSTGQGRLCRLQRRAMAWLTGDGNPAATSGPPA